MTDCSSDNEFVIACTPDNVPADERMRWMNVGMETYRAVEEVRELADGYALRLPNDAATLIKTAEYVSLDRQCCQFVQWSIVVDPNLGPVWLHVAGSEGAKEYLRTTIETTTLLREEIALAAGFDITRRAEWTHPSDPALSTANY